MLNCETIFSFGCKEHSYDQTAGRQAGPGWPDKSFEEFGNYIDLDLE